VFRQKPVGVAGENSIFGGKLLESIQEIAELFVGQQTPLELASDQNAREISRRVADVDVWVAARAGSQGVNQWQDEFLRQRFRSEPRQTQQGFIVTSQPAEYSKKGLNRTGCLP
jgi:hypothetical protein